MLARSSVPRETQTPVTAIYMIPKWLPSQNSRVQNANLCHKFQFGHFNLRCTVNFHFAWWSCLERKKIEWEMGKDTQNMEVSKRENTNEWHIMCVEVRKSTEFSLPQAQVLYISSTNKFILVKATNLSLSPFMPSCTPISSTIIIISISSWSGVTKKTTTQGPNFHMVTGHVKDGSKPCWRAFWRSLQW